MKKLVLKVINENWGMIGPDDWNKTEWKIYDDLSVTIKIKYNQDKLNKEYKSILSLEKYKKILKNINKSKRILVRVDACDGEAWEFIQYNDSKIVWKRMMSYIYGLKHLEDIGKELNSLINDLMLYNSVIDK